jgi:hypothetical protein
MGKNKTGSLILFLTICYAVAFIAEMITRPEIPTWYATLAKPAWRPTNWLFGPVDSAVWINGNRGVESLVRCFIEVAHNFTLDICPAVDPQFPLVSYLFFSTPHRSCVFRDRQSGNVSTFIHCADVEVRARSRLVS